MKKGYMAAIMALAYASSTIPYSPELNSPEPTLLTPEEVEERRRRVLANHGLKEFDIDGVIVWAINRKNAERKAKKLLNEAK
jgi:hypothetical protein